MKPKTLLEKYAWQLIAIWWFVQGFFCYGHAEVMFNTIGVAVMIIAFVLFLFRYRPIRSICSFILVFYSILFFGLGILLFRHYDARAVGIAMFAISVGNVFLLAYSLKRSFLLDMRRYKIFGGGE